MENTELDKFLGVDLPYPDKELLNCPRCPKPLHGQNPRTIMGQKNWDITRREAYAKFGYKCMACGIHRDDEHIIWKNQLHAHEVYDIDYENCKVVLKNIVALCECCHAFIHDGRSHSLFDNGEMDITDIFLVMNRGLKLLGRQKDRHPLDNDKYYVKTWDKWKLVIGDKEYKSKFKSINEWAKFYSAKKED